MVLIFKGTLKRIRRKNLVSIDWVSSPISLLLPCSLFWPWDRWIFRTVYYLIKCLFLCEGFFYLFFEYFYQLLIFLNIINKILVPYLSISFQNRNEIKLNEIILIYLDFLPKSRIRIPFQNMHILIGYWFSEKMWIGI